MPDAPVPDTPRYPVDEAGFSPPEYAGYSYSAHPGPAQAVAADNGFHRPVHRKYLPICRADAQW